MTARKTSVAVTPQLDALVRRRGENFSAALRQMVVTYDYLIAAGLTALTQQRLDYFAVPERRVQLMRAWGEVVPNGRNLGETLCVALHGTTLYPKLRELTALELIALYDTILQARAA